MIKRRMKEDREVLADFGDDLRDVKKNEEIMKIGTE